MHGLGVFWYGLGLCGMILGEFGLGCMFGTVWECLGQFWQFGPVWHCLQQFGYLFGTVRDSQGLFGCMFRTVWD